MPTQLISYLQDTGFDLYNMREWLSGGAPPSHGGGRGFDPRLALEKRMIPNGLAFFSSVGLGSKVRCLSLRIRVLFCMHMTAGPDFTGLGLIGGAAEEEAFQCGTVKGEEGPEVTEACEGWCVNHRE